MKNVVVVIMSLFALPAVAQNTGGVFGPGVKEGHRSFQYRAAFDPDNNNDETGFAHRIHYQQSINGDFRWRILGQARKTSESNSDFDFVQAELLWQLDQTDDYQSALRFDLRKRDDGRPSQFGFNWIHQYKLANDWHARLLLLTSVQFGSDAADGITLQTRGSIWKKTSIGNLGIELFNNYGSTDKIKDFDDQNHSIGPFISKTVGNNGWSIFAGALFGITDPAPDAELRFWVTKSL